MSELQLLHTTACHLCEEAERIVERVIATHAPIIYQRLGELYLEQIDIAESDALINVYGTRIPVLRLITDPCEAKELDWPFDEAKFLNFLFEHV